MERLEGRTLLSQGVVPDYRVTQDWSSGFQAEMSLANQDAQPVAGWTLAFDYPSQISSIWDARIVSHAGNHYVLAGAGWNNDLAGRGKVAFGFVAAPGHPTSAPANLLLNGAPLSGSTSPPPPPVLPVVSIGDATVTEGTSGTTTASFSLGLSQASTSTVTVRYSTADGTAVAGADYQATSGVITFAPGQTQQNVAVTVVGDTVAEPTESFAVNLDSPAGATLGKAQGTGTILNSTPPATGQFQFHVDSDWGSGFTGQITVSNPGTSAIGAWTLAFEFTGQISAIWNARVVSHTGNQYVVSGADWNRAIPARGSISFGFNASPGGNPAAPTNYRLTDGTTPSGGPVAPPSQVSAWPDRVYAPYVDMGLYPTYDLAAAARSQGIRYFTLAFVVADPSGRPSWGGYSEYAVDGGAFDQGVRQQLAAVRSLGGDAMVSFGGAANRELAEVITDPVALANAYRTVIDAYNLTHIDFDIEGAAVANRASIDRRSDAIATLQREAASAGRTLDVAFTLPVLPTGLTNDGLYVLQSAISHGVRIDGVNIMAMDYGDSAAPSPQGHMGDYTIAAAESLFGQLRGLYGATMTDEKLWAMIGLTPMIGVNDVTTEVFDLAAAQEVANFAAQHGIGRISIWSLNRDVASPRGALTYAESTSSSIVQDPFAFSQIFKGYQS